ncbi:MAG: GTPase ObgE [Planctomycetes bacterium RBG_16_64_10]|nr:MAG: GTPase ObgE [Planctomycetes bacterium RBG_16_64_10]
MFVDRVDISVEAGKGGDGCVSFHRAKYVPRGGPDGGDGGHGGSVVVVAKAGVDSLAALAHRKQWKALAGQRGAGSNRHGRSAADLIIPVPPGTLVRDPHHGYVLKDLLNDGDRVCVARGGKGGRGNVHFKSATNQTPREATPGSEGERRAVQLELKLIADVGLTGKPNAGKSTLLSRLSRARPQIADYPFTTRRPNLGIVQVDVDRTFVLADIPGLIEGAHAGAGMGHEFLRHVERTRVLVHLVEPQPADGSQPVHNYRAIRTELQRYQVDLTQRPEIVVLTKADLPGAEDQRRQLAAQLEREILAISAVTGQGLDRLVRQIVEALAQADRPASAH